MIYSFLTYEDLRVAIKEAALNSASENDNSNIIKAINRAVDYMKSFMNQRYNMDDTFPLIRQWVSNKNYQISQEQTVITTDELGNKVTTTFFPLYFRVDGEIVNYVYHLGKIYRAAQDNTNITPGEESDNWIECDPRSQQVVGFCSDISIFFLNQKINPRKIPDLRIDAYNQAKEWITLIKDDEITPDLPKKIDIKQDIDTMLWGSSPRIGGLFY